MTILGSLVLQSERPVAELVLPELATLSKKSGHHVSGRYNGSFVEYFDTEPVEVLIPQRYKRMTVLSDSWVVRHDLAEELSTLDAQYADARQLYKLHQLLKRFDSATYAATVNILNTGVDDHPVSGAFYLMASNEPLYVSVLLDSNSGSAQLVWSTFDHKKTLQAMKAFNYSVYAMPTLTKRPLFVPSLALCSKWWRLTQRHSTKWGLMKACNALELILYKDPELPSIDHGLR
jgi:hypothetical protein